MTQRVEKVRHCVHKQMSRVGAVSCPGCTGSDDLRVVANIVLGKAIGGTLGGARLQVFQKCRDGSEKAYRSLCGSAIMSNLPFYSSGSSPGLASSYFPVFPVHGTVV